VRTRFMWHQVDSRQRRGDRLVSQNHAVRKDDSATGDNIEVRGVIHQQSAGKWCICAHAPAGVLATSHPEVHLMGLYAPPRVSKKPTALHYRVGERRKDSVRRDGVPALNHESAMGNRRFVHLSSPQKLSIYLSIGPRELIVKYLLKYFRRNFSSAKNCFAMS